MCELKRPPKAFYILSHGCIEGLSRLMTFCLWMISDFQRVPISHLFYLIMIWWNQVTLQGFFQGLSILLWSANTEETHVPEMPLNCEGTSSCTGFSDILSTFAVGLSHQPNRLSSSWRYYVNKNLVRFPSLLYLMIALLSLIKWSSATVGGDLLWWPMKFILSFAVVFILHYYTIL